MKIKLILLSASQIVILLVFVAAEVFSESRTGFCVGALGELGEFRVWV